MSQPIWKRLWATDYSQLFEDTTGVYSPELEIAQESHDHECNHACADDCGETCIHECDNDCGKKCVHKCADACGPRLTDYAWRTGLECKHDCDDDCGKACTHECYDDCGKTCAHDCRGETCRMRWYVYRFDLERLKLVADDEDATKFYLVPYAYDATWPHPPSSYVEWFADDLPSIASSAGTTAAALIADLTSDDVNARASAYQDIGGYHGFDNFDSYPLECTEAELNERWSDKTPRFAAQEGKS